MTTFALVHGAWHDGWCWHLLEERLRGRGHETVAPTLPIEDVGASFEDYADVVAAALQPDGGPVVVVGHSVAGRWLHLVGERLRPQFFGMIDREASPDLRALPSAAIACRDDEFFSLEYERWAARELLGAPPLELDGGHFPMLEQPDRLAAALEELA